MDDLPTFLCVRNRRTNSMSFICPRCAKKNTHGCCGKVFGAGDGHRVSHCPCWKNGYYVAEWNGGKDGRIVCNAS